MIIWHGKGILVLVFSAFAFFVAALIVKLMNLQPPYIAVAYGVTEIPAGAAIWMFARRIESGPDRVFIDKASGQEISVRPSAGSLFFIPTRYWAFVLPGAFILAAIAAVLGYKV